MSRKGRFFSSLVIFLSALTTVQAQEASGPATDAKVIIIDPGHGGKDPGTLTKRTKEKDITLAMAKRLGSAIQQRIPSKILYTRTKDQFISLAERNRIANRNSCDFFVSVHVNSSPSKEAKGLEVYYLNNATDRAASKLAARENQGAPKAMKDVQAILSGLLQNDVTDDSAQAAGYVRKSLVQQVGKVFSVAPIRVKTALFYVLVGAKCPSLLVETGFITNPKEEQRLRSTSYQKALAQAVANGMKAYFDSLAHPRSDL